MKYKGELAKYWEYDNAGNPTRFVSNYGDVASKWLWGCHR